MKTYTIRTLEGREIARYVGVNELFKFIPRGFKPSGSAPDKFSKPHQVFKRRVGPTQFETIMLIEDQES